MIKSKFKSINFSIIKKTLIQWVFFAIEFCKIYFYKVCAAVNAASACVILPVLTSSFKH